ncbi:nitroreductase/quinone reductase family protein [uncultured Mycolicibacterium sp.]|uniref:nitroreductase/quinone reductase family protein n=1 Tax=uncultured Mycolicibacterium sp. TaxID=2320817 RepID=UPI00261C4A1E|nr:nitroreductase/quinone reductase family protein [uncultured Mycolicibacterium sp.]
MGEARRQTGGSDAFNREVIREFRTHGGRVGGVFEGKPMLLLHHRGARSGRDYLTPLVPLLDDGRIYVFATNGGADTDPAWYRNLLAHPDVAVELGTGAFPATARVLTGAERAEVYARQAALLPQFAEYRRSTARPIPVVELVRTGPGPAQPT